MGCKTPDFPFMEVLVKKASFTLVFSILAIIALLAGALPSLPGFLAHVKAIKPDAVAPALVHIYNYAWFVGFIVSGISYYLFIEIINSLPI